MATPMRVVLLAVLLAATPTAAAASPAASPVADPSPSPGPASPGPSVLPFAVVAVPLDGTMARPGAVWHASVPRLVGGPDPAVTAAVNAAIAAHIDAAVRWFEAQPVERPRRDARLDTGTIDHEVTLLTDRLLSLRFLATFSAAGAAHPAAEPSTLTIDLATGRPLALADLALPGADLLGRLSRASREDLLARYSDRETPRASIRAGTRPRPRNFSAWAVTPDGLELTFAEYQVGPYSLGRPVVTVPWSELAGLIDPAGPLGPLAAGSGPTASPTGSSGITPATSPEVTASPRA